MSKLQALFKFLMMAVLLLVFAATGVGGFYGYRTFKAQRELVQRQTAQLEKLTGDREELRERLRSLRKHEQEMTQENEMLRADAVKYENEKGVILNQVRNSVSGFESFRQEATGEIDKLKQSMAELENEKTDIEERLENTERISDQERDTFISSVKFLNTKIENHRQMRNRLAESLQNKDRSPIVVETAKMHYNLGNFYFRNGDAKNAAAEYKKALFYQPDDADAHFNLALVADEYLEDRPAAVIHYRLFLQHRPDAENAQRVRDRILDLQIFDRVIAEPKAKKVHDVFADREAFSEFHFLGDKT